MSPLQLAYFYSIQAAYKVSVNPDSSSLPGGAAAQKLLNGAAGFGLLGCVGAVIWGAALWGLGTRSNNYAQADDGKAKMLKGAGGAFGVGAAAAVINFFFNAGTAVK